MGQNSPSGRGSRGTAASGQRRYTVTPKFPGIAIFERCIAQLPCRKPKNDRGLKSHPNVHLHFTPTHTSWLNQIECWFSILSRQALQGASFVDVKQLREAIDHFICAYNEQAAPFEWRQTEIKQQPLRDNIAYFGK